MYGMDESSKQLKKFEESGHDTECLKHAYGFINGFYKGVDIPLLYAPRTVFSLHVGYSVRAFMRV